MFKSIYSFELNQYYTLRSSTLSMSALQHEECYLRRFDDYLSETVKEKGILNEDCITKWIGRLRGKSSSIENQVIVIRQFLKYLELSGEKVFMPVIPKVHDDYVPYLFSDDELKRIFNSADNIVQRAHNTDSYLVYEFPVILRLLYSCGLRIGETLNLRYSDVDFNAGVLHMKNTKGDKERLVPMSAEMTDILIQYCIAMNVTVQGDNFLFPSYLNRDKHISDRSVKHRFEYILKENEISLPNRNKHERGPCLHCLRHVFAFKSFSKSENSGMRLDDAIPYLSIYLGHDSLNETAKYLKFSSELFPKAVTTFEEYIADLLPEVDYET